MYTRVVSSRGSLFIGDWKTCPVRSCMRGDRASGACCGVGVLRQKLLTHVHGPRRAILLVNNARECVNALLDDLSKLCIYHKTMWSCVI